jgi:surface protein
MKKITLLLSLTFCFHLLLGQQFITMWDLSKPGSTLNAITFGITSTGNVKYFWETIPAGTSDSGIIVGTTANIYGLPSNAIIKLKIDTGNFRNFNQTTDQSRLIDVVQWGATKWSFVSPKFNGCNNLNITAIDIPNFSFVFNLDQMFNGCTILNGPTNINNWNIGTVTSINNMFKNAVSFNQPIGNWNTSNIKYMTSIFEGASSFNQPIGNWNTSNVEDMISIFKGASSFNQPIGNWNIGKITDMESMFYGAVNFNQPIGNWNTSNVENMNNLFCNATVFNENINNWDVSNVRYFQSLFKNAINFNQPLSNWDTKSAGIMKEMFNNALNFNQPVYNFKTKGVINMSSMFLNAKKFDQNISNFGLHINLNNNGLSFNPDLSRMLDSCAMNCNNYSAIFKSWRKYCDSVFIVFNTNNISIYLINSFTTLGAVNMQYNNVCKSDRKFFTDTLGWVINGDINIPNCITGIDDLNSRENHLFTIFPNPSSKMLFIESKYGDHVSLINMLGEVIFTEKLIGSQVKMNISNLPKAVYYVRINNVVEKVLIE